jgi:RNA polymerase sigma-70 factor (ECF subfamily)
MVEQRNPEGTVQSATSHAEARDPATELGEVYRQYHARVLRAAYRVTGNAQDAEDVLQTVFMRLARREGGSPLSDSPGSYLHRAAINAALDMVRSRKAGRSTSLEEVGPTLAADSEAEPDRVQGASEIREQVRLALSGMSPKSAEIFALRYFEGYGNHEIARMLGTSRSTVNVILHRTRQKLKEQIRGYVGDGQ